MDVDLSIPEGAPPEVVARLAELQAELEEGDITAKGYRKHREQVLSNWLAAQPGAPTEYAPSVYSAAEPSIRSRRRQSGIESVYSYPTSDPVLARQVALPQGPALAELVAAKGPLQRPLAPRGIPEGANTDPLNTGVRLTQFDNLPSILRHRGKTNADLIAFMVLDAKGKESQAITWAKLAGKAEKVGQMLRDQSGLFRGDRVGLLYADNEPIEFVIAMMGCFLAGLVAVPLSPKQMSVLHLALQSTQAKLVLTTEHQHKSMLKNHADKMPRFKDVQFWRTTDWGTYNPPRKGAELPALQVPDLAYIDYAWSPTGELRGVVMSHRTLIHQMMGLMAILRSKEVYAGQKRAGADRILCSLDMRRSTGLIIGVLLTIYAGNCTYFLSSASMSTPGLYAHVVTRNRMTILLSDYPALKQVTYNYQTAPQATRNFSKRQQINLSTLRWCLIDAATVDTEFQMVLADRWLKPLGSTKARDIVAPMLTLTEHGGMVIAMRDWLAAPDAGDNYELGEVNIDRAALRKNRVEFVQPGPNALSVAPFGFPLPDATVAIVDPDTTILAGEYTVGELWVDSPSLSGGFWGLASDTETTFHARCLDEQGPLPLEFLRTGLLGFVAEGLVYVLGLLEDRLVYEPLKENGQVATAGDTGSSDLSQRSTPLPPDTLSYTYSPHLVSSIMRAVPGVFDCCVFQFPIEGKLQAVIVFETPVAKPVPQPNAMTKQEHNREQTLDSMCQQAISVLGAVDKFPVYCAIATAPNATPRIIRSGRPDIAKLLAKRQYIKGSLASVHVRFNVLPILPGLARGQDVSGGIWSPAISHIRSQSLADAEKQYSGVDMRSAVMDERMATSLDKFQSLIHLLQWRATRQPDELAYQTVAIRPADIKRETTWRKLDQRVASVLQYLRDHLRVKAGDAAVLMYTHGEDYVTACLACFALGVTVVPIAPINLDRLDEDMGALSRTMRRFKIHLLLGNHDTHQLMEDKRVSQWMKQQRTSVGKIHNTAKVKVAPTHTLKNVTVPKQALGKQFPALVWLTWNADHEVTASQLSHDSILGMCKIQKETCQMTATKPIIGCVRSVMGLGFLYTVCLGIYVGASTLLVSPVDFANNPSTYFLTVSRYKIKDGYATVQMLEHACRASKPKGYSLSELSNLVVPVISARADTNIVTTMRETFNQVSLDPLAINIAYATDANPMITTRSYMLVDSIDLWLDPIALRQGYVSVVNPANCPNALHLQDSGMVPINTQIAIVNPETRRLCRTGEFGEIWVVSDGNQAAYYQRDATTNNQLMRGVIEDGDPAVEYMRTGDFGFLHSVTKGLDIEMQVLFVLGPISMTIEVNGLQHFVVDVETSVEAHANVDSACLFVAAHNMTVMVVETSANKDNLPSMASLVVNTVLDDHDFVVDVVTFIAKGKLPRSRLFEKQRKKLIEQYVDGKLPILSQYGVQSQSQIVK